MARSVNRSARTGRFVSNAAAARWPGKTTTERVGRGTGNSRTVYRSAYTGEFITPNQARRDPGGSMSSLCATRTWPTSCTLPLRSLLATRAAGSSGSSTSPTGMWLLRCRTAIC